IFELAEYKTLGACKKLVVSGCLSQRYPGQLAEQMPEVDHFLGSSDMMKLGEVLGGKADRMLVGNPADWVVRATDPRVVTQSRASAWLKIAEGCNRTCAFCVIPQIRGKQRSRTADDVVAEAERLVDAGAIELNLVSQDTIAYGRDLPKDDRAPLADLVRRVADVKGVRWVRVFYLYPETMDDALVDLLASHPRVVPYVDMPLQHAADAMLRRMRRWHGKDRQRRVVERLRKAVPGLTFRTAFIVGHPGETQTEFDELVEFVEWARFEHAVVFRYSDEETCGANTLPDKVPTLVAANRARKLMALQRKIAREKNRALIGREMDVLVEGPSEEHELVMKGRHAGQAPDIDGSVYLSGGEAHPGQMRRVTITQASDFDLVGELKDEGSPAVRAPDRRVALKVLGGGGSEPRWQ
ncbi:MAG: 30S ribosomal protein S12 methylthiotransferase RimO, partial [Polyangiaceae bacterium]